MYKLKLENETKEIIYKKAKTNPNKTIYEHTKEVLDKYNEFFKEYPDSFSDDLKELIYIACYYHDFGKANELFQKKLETGKNHIDGEIPHGFLSAQFIDKDKIIEEYGLAIYRALVTAVFYHHTRELTLKGPAYDSAVKQNVTEPFNIKQNFNIEELIFRYPSGVTANPTDKEWEYFVKIKGMLNHFDYAASGNLKVEEENHNLDIKTSIVNKFKLTPMQEYAKDHVNDNLILIGSTGSGKTESALLWLDKEKGFYTLPLKVASNAIYVRILKNYADNDVKALALLHSDGYDILNKTSEEANISYDDYKEMKMLSYPLTICTVDQIFKFPFKALGQEHFIANLSYSKVIIDEIQMYSATITACLINGLKSIIEYGGHFLITTATFPKYLKELLEEKLGDKYVIKNFISKDEIKRHYPALIDGMFDYEKIIESSKSKKVLVICNTVKMAINTYKNLKKLNPSEIHLLHSRFIKADRERLEEEIKTFDVDRKKSGIWVTTQIVEASLDIDFDELHTELSPADSLIQRFGRCYRKREYLEDIPNIYIYDDNNDSRIYEKNLLKLTKEKLMTYVNKTMTEIDKQEFLDSVYDKEILKAHNTKYIEDLEKSLDIFENIKPMLYDNNEIERLFRDINNITVIPDVVYIANEEIIKELIEKLNSKISAEERYKIRRELEKYTVSIYKTKVDELLVDGIYREQGSYSSEIGFENEVNDEDRFI